MKLLPIVAASALVAVSWSALAQDCKTDSIEPSIDPEQMIDKRDGTVTDAKTGLTWTQCSLGQTWTESGCEGSADSFTWQEALQAAQQFNNEGGIGGHTDWRLPNIKELGSIVEHQCDKPAINLTFFPDTPSMTYLSSTLDLDGDGNSDGGRSINFETGSDLTAEVNVGRSVRLVRGD